MGVLTKWGGFKLGDFSASVKIGDKRDRIGTLKYMAEYVARVEHGASHALYTGVAKTGHIRRTHCTLTC